MVAIGEEQRQRRGAAEQVLDFEGVDVGVVGGFVVVEHEVEGVGLGGEEEEFEGRVVRGAGGQGPEYVWCVVYLMLDLGAMGKRSVRWSVPD